MGYSTMWEAKENLIMNTIQIIGVPYGLIPKAIALRLLLEGAVELANLAEKYNGKLMEYEPKPQKGNIESIYFEIIFRNSTDLKNFLKAIENESS